MNIEAELLIAELKAQRNAIADSLAIAGARIVALTRQVEELTKKTGISGGTTDGTDGSS